MLPVGSVLHVQARHARQERPRADVMDPLRRLDGPLRWVLADETQDNSRIRQLMLQRLVAESGCRIFVVGDDMQDCTTE